MKLITLALNLGLLAGVILSYLLEDSSLPWSVVGSPTAPTGMSSGTNGNAAASTVASEGLALVLHEGVRLARAGGEMRIVNERRAKQRFGPFREVVDDRFAQVLSTSYPTRAYRCGILDAMVSVEPWGLHMSVSTPGRYPKWDEIAHARYELLPPDLVFALLFPPADEYVNIEVEGLPRSGNVFHLHEVRRQDGKLYVPEAGP